MPTFQFLIVRMYFKQWKEGIYYNFGFFSWFLYESPGNVERLVCSFCTPGRYPAGDNYLSRVLGFFFSNLK